MTIKSFIKKYVFPKRYTCMICFNEAVVDENNVCSCCRKNLTRFNSVLKRKDIDEMTSMFIYDEKINRAIWGLKYNGQRYIAETLGSLMDIKEDWYIDCVTAVPLSPKRLRKRGYNQSAELAKKVCKRYGLKFDEELLKKIKETPAQANLTASERRKNLKGAFRVTKSCDGLCVLLIDDVVTTSSTVDECALMLKKAGAQKVYVLTACISGKTLAV